MNKEIIRLLEIIKIFNNQKVLEKEFKVFANNLKENEHLSVKELIEMAETEMSYWEA